MKKKVLNALLAGTAMSLTLTMSGITAMADETETEVAAEDAEEEEENYETGDASKDNPRNQDEIGRRNCW